MSNKNIKFSVLLIAIIILGAFLRIRLSQDPYLHKWDERFHALVAKNLMDHPLKPVLYKDAILDYDYKAWYSNYIWLHKQPLPLWLIAGSYKTFGISEFATRIPSILFSVLSILVLYLLGKELFDRRTGLLAAFFLSINGLVIEMCSGRIATDHYDTLFLVFIEIAILFGCYSSVKRLKRYAILSGAFMGFAILTKWLPGLIVLPVHFCLLCYSGNTLKDTIKAILLSVFTAVVIAAPWQLYIITQFPAEAKWEYYHNWLHITNELDGQKGGYFYFLGKIRINYSEIVYLPLLYLIYRLYKTKCKDLRLLALFVWIVIPMLFFSLAKTKMQGYVLFICPALFLIIADFYFILVDYLKEKQRPIAIKIFTGLILIAIIVLPVRYCIERTGMGFKGQGQDTMAEAYKKVTSAIPKHTVVIGVKEPIEFMFYNNCIAYSDTFLTEANEVKIRNQNYKLYRYNEKESTLTRIHNLNF